MKLLVITALLGLALAADDYGKGPAKEYKVAEQKVEYGYEKGYEKKSYGDKGYDNKGYDNKGYDNKGYDNKGYDGKGYEKGYGYESRQVYHGKYGGKCSNDGFYYNNENSFVICSNGNSYQQKCAPGSKNSGYNNYEYGRNYYYHDFCDVNLVDYGYGVGYGYGKDSYGKDSYGYGKDSYGYGKDSYGKDSYGEKSYGYKESYGSDRGYGGDSYGYRGDGYRGDNYRGDAYRGDNYGYRSEYRRGGYNGGYRGY